MTQFLRVKSTNDPLDIIVNVATIDHVAANGLTCIIQFMNGSEVTVLGDLDGVIDAIGNPRTRHLIRAT